MAMEPSVAAVGGDKSNNMAVGVLYHTTLMSSGRVGWRLVDQMLVTKARFTSYIPAKPMDEFIKAEAALDEYGLAILENHRGTGKETDAIRLLSATSPVSTSVVDVYELLPDWEGAPSTRDFPLSSDTRLLLDLSDVTEEIPEAFADELMAYARNLRELNSRIVVTVTDKAWQRCRPKLRGHTATIPRRRASSVIRAHLTFHDHREVLGLLEQDAVRAFVAELDEGRTSPDYAVKVADRLRLVRTAADIDRTIGELRKWRPYIDQQLDSRKPNWADRRMLLIAAAVLNGCPSTAVAAASRALATALGHETVPLFKALESEGWSRRLREIGATVADDCTWIDRDKPGVDYAIFEWLWNEHPELRGPVLKWTRDLVTDPKTKKHARRVIGVIAYVAGECRSVDLLEALYAQLKSPRAEAYRGLVEEAVEGLLFHPAAAALTQERLWRWAYRGDRGAFPSLALLCGGRLGREHPFVALARLRHLIARAELPEHRAAVAAALRGLAREPRLRQPVLAKVVSWAEDNFASGLIMLLDARCDGAVADLLVRDAEDNVAAFDLLVRAWDLLSSDDDQDRVAELTAGWSVERDLGHIGALTLARVWEPIVHKVFSGSPEAVFISAMTPETRADTLQYVMSRSAAPHVNGFAFGAAAFPVEETHPRENLHRDT
ncbi:hypothetical protein KBX53_00440 [Micromonospora sp. M51]|uniref:hypothetical protein n=1 Tax=Micromonospora sp. M51 TaxID=2824889 RepID=UPI001B38501E|nr:hypothetical protein [Micromonospora sp. M51]MBQ1009449.1 hypothetical protein [Micromonospora sp. M51]